VTGDEEKLPALFATIHFRSTRRPDGYTDDEIAELNRAANPRDPINDEGDSHDDPDAR